MGVREGTEETALCKPFLKVTQWRIVITLMQFYNAFLWRFKCFEKVSKYYIIRWQMENPEQWGNKWLPCNCRESEVLWGAEVRSGEPSGHLVTASQMPWSAGGKLAGYGEIFLKSGNKSEQKSTFFKMGKDVWWKQQRSILGSQDFITFSSVSQRILSKFPEIIAHRNSKALIKDIAVA